MNRQGIDTIVELKRGKLNSGPDEKKAAITDISGAVAITVNDMSLGLLFS